MKQFITSIFPQDIFTTKIRFGRLILGLWMMLVLVLQLFTFEKFSATMSFLGALSFVCCVFIVIAELISLPYLLLMRVLHSVGVVSYIFSCVVPVIWIFEGIMGFVYKTSSALFGATISIPVIAEIAIGMIWLCATVIVNANDRPRLKS